MAHAPSLRDGFYNALQNQIVQCTISHAPLAMRH
jgi:hypothetical protein